MSSPFISRVVTVLLAAPMAFFAGGCGTPPKSPPLRIEGSTIMAKLAEGWAEALRKLPSPLESTVSSQGSGAGARDFIDGRVDVATSSRRWSQSELTQAASHGARANETCVGYAVYAAIVNPSNPVSSLTTRQLDDLFAGRIRDWAALGGPKQPIVTVHHRVGPGQIDRYVTEQAGAEQAKLPEGALVKDTTEQIAATIANTSNAIGYLLLKNLTASVKALGVRAAEGQPAVTPSYADAAAGRYPLLRPLYIYTNEASTAPVDYFRDFVLGRKGLAIVEGLEIVPPREHRFETDAERLFHASFGGW